MPDTDGLEKVKKKMFLFKFSGNSYKDIFILILKDSFMVICVLIGSENCTIVGGKKKQFSHFLNLKVKEFYSEKKN